MDREHGTSERPFTEASLREALVACRRAGQEAHVRATEIVRSSEATLDALEVSVRAVLRADKVRGTEDTTSKLEKMHERLSRISDLLRVDLRALLQEQRERTQAFQIALFGRTKAGKSTLYGALSREPGAEHHIGRGGDRTTKDVRTYTAAGITFVDVPGICAFGRDGRFDEEIAKKVVEPSDVILFLVTDDGVQDGELEELYQLRLFNKPLLLVHNLKLGLGDEFTLGRARAGKERLFNERRLHEHTRRIDRYFREKGIRGPDRVIPIHADAAWRSIHEQDPSLKNWYRAFSHIADLERALVEYLAERGGFIRSATYFEPLVRFHSETVDSLRKDLLGIGKHRRFITEKQRALVALMSRLEQDCTTKLDSLRSTFSAIESQIDGLIDQYKGEALLSKWTEVLNGEGPRLAIESLASSITSDINAGLAEFRREAEYDAAAVARDIDIECQAEVPTLGKAGRWWRRGATVVQAASMAGYLGGPLLGTATTIAGQLVGYLLRRYGDRVERDQRQAFEESREAARRVMLEALRKKESDLRRNMTEWLQEQLGSSAQRRVRAEFDRLLKDLDEIRAATNTCGRELASTTNRINISIVEDAFRVATQMPPPPIIRVARAQGSFVKGFSQPVPSAQQVEATERLLNERVHLLLAQSDAAAEVAAALAPANVSPRAVQLRTERDPYEWPLAIVSIPESERALAIGARGSNITLARQLCRVRIRIDNGARRTA
ncbi:MAG: GTPase [Kofleriaceae bacterium]